MAELDSASRDLRPSPDALLAAAAREARGKLRIFLGAAPGVGKTYEMLQSARRRKAEGADVVIGVVETHGRKETEALVDGLEIVPRRNITYEGRVLTEMDIDAILARRPALVLVDELAHTNAPGSRHPKRYLDVEELLTAGIDVYTTVNIQHLESLNDIVAQITRVRVRETVPDRIVDAAEVEVIDLTPDDLIQRLQEGKVYVPDQAERALKHYFSPGNLTALRELALRRAAERVDEQMVSYMQEHAIAGPWAAGERLLVCISEQPGAAQLVRYAKRVADRLHGPWTALYVETPRHQRLSEAQRDRVVQALRLAEQLGADTITVPGQRIADDVLSYARENNATQIIIGRSTRSRWFEMLHGSVVHDLLRRAGDISVHVIAGAAGTELEKTVKPSAGLEAIDPFPYAISTALVAAALGVALLISQFVDLDNISLVFLAAVLASAVRYGAGPSVFAALLSVACYNFFFLPPLYTFTIADPANVVALFFFMIVALLTSSLTARTRTQAVIAQRQAKTTAELYSFSKKLAGIAKLDDLLWATAHQIALMLRVEVVLLTPEDGSIAVRAGFPPEDQLDDADLAAAKWCWDHNQPAGRGADTLPGAKRLFLPLRTGRGIVGVLGINRKAPGPLFTPDERRLLDALADQAAVAIERTQLAEDIDEARVLAETERLRSSLLTSISHDLRTPLASIIGTITSLRSFGKLYDDRTRDEMLATAQDEGERLNRFVANLLDMTRLDSGAVELKREMIDLSDVIGSALQRCGKMLAGHRVAVVLAPELPMFPLDFLLMEQVLVNLLDNAGKYAPAGSAIEISGRRDGAEVVIEVRDEGPGIPPGDLERIFDKFYRVHNGDRQRAGTGLGLAICRGFVEAQGGTITAANRTDRSGAVFTIRIPVDDAIAEAVEAKQPAHGE
ncbi:MAG TPA: sensor histidine kinase KdpD [Candidatus Acidoferrum sp.]|nr:sensor histidine kinase KdpD [Candidatus Acidoferrum sp.]